jgi:DNA-binding NarL/FixJ family response regulator
MSTSPQSLSPSLNNLRLLVAEPDAAPALLTATRLSRAGASVFVARSRSALQAALERSDDRFDAAIIDWSPIDGRGPELVARLCAAERPCFVVALAVTHDADAVESIALSGALEVLFKPVEDAELLEACVRTARATAGLRGALTERLAPVAHAREELRTASVLRRPAHAVPASRPGRAIHGEVEHVVAVFAELARLSPRERSVLRFIALGYRYQDIGEALSISPRTVKMHAANVRKKAGVATRWELLRKVLPA